MNAKNARKPAKPPGIRAQPRGFPSNNARIPQRHRTEAEQNRTEAEQNRTEAEQNRTEAEQNRTEAEQNRTEAEQNRTEAEQTRTETEQNHTGTRPNKNSRTEQKHQALRPRQNIGQPASPASAAPAPATLRNPTNPNPKVRKSGAVGKAVLASMVLEEGSIRDARGDSSRDIRIHREPRGWKSCVVRGAPSSLYGLFFGRSFGKVIKAQGGPRWCRGWWSIVSKNRLTANNTEQKWCLTRGSPDTFHNARSLRR